MAQPKAKDFARAGAAAYHAGDKVRAMNALAQAVLHAPKNRDHKIQFCELVKDISFQSFNQTFKDLILQCLETKGVDHQSLSRSWFSMLMCDPAFKALQNVFHGKVADVDDLNRCAQDQYFTSGLRTLIVFDMRFEQMLLKIKDTLGDVFDVYCERTEYIFCDDTPRGGLDIDESIQSLGISDNAVSNQVRAQYEENPYPRWTSIHMQTPPRETADKMPDYLVAGCGTGYGLCMTALRYPKAKITAIDLSLASLSYAKKKSQELGLKNINFYQADILNLDALEQEFDIIECSGVLHHMADSIAGWAALTPKLKKNGRTHIGLYSEAGRRDVVAARNLIASQGFKVTPAGIRDARALISKLPQEHPAAPVRTRRDFYSQSDCRDLLFHVQEHRFTIEKIKEALDTLGLVFDEPQSLDDWKILEEKNPDTFKGMYQFWCSPK